MVGSNWDQALLLKLNTIAGGHAYIYDFADNALFRGFPIFFSLVALWFADDDGKRRSRILAGLAGVCIATVLSVWCQFHVQVHTRPLIDAALHLKTVELRGSTWDRTSSFPSDTATLFFGLVTVILLEKRLVGLLCFLWTVFVIAIPRVAFGLHYPSDIIGSLILGPACVLFFSKLPYPRLLIERMLLALKDRMYAVHALFFIFLAEASNLFRSLEEIGKDLVKLLHS
jgi:membrane-associated phospholipid phosphatase